MAALEEKLRHRGLTNEERLELALLNIEPGHDGFRAVELLREMPAGSPSLDLARLWISYCCIYELMDDDALREAVRLCDELLERRPSARVQAAALLLKAASLRQLGSGHDTVAELRESVRLEPTWVANHQFLATVYEELGDRVAAEDELRKAIEVSRLPQESASHADQLFEMLITARGSHQITKRLQDQLGTLRNNSGLS